MAEVAHGLSIFVCPRLVVELLYVTATFCSFQEAVGMFSLIWSSALTKFYFLIPVNKIRNIQYFYFLLHLFKCWKVFLCAIKVFTGLPPRMLCDTGGQGKCVCTANHSSLLCILIHF